MTSLASLEVDLEAARSRLQALASRAAALVAGAGDLSTPVPRLGWTVGQTAAHLVVALRAYTDALNGNLDRWRPYLPETPHYQERLSAVNERTIADQPSDDAADLSAGIEEAARAFLAASGTHDADDTVPTPWYEPGAQLSLRAATCLLLGEQLIHGHDIAITLRRPWPIGDDDARLAVHATIAMMPIILKREAIGKEFAYGIRLRGGPHFVIRNTGASLTVAPADGQKVDCWVAGSAATYIMIGYGRLNQWHAIARGRLFAWGRKPWLALKLVDLFHRP